MLVVVMLFLVASLLFYCVLGGADFGAGALGFFVPPKNRQRHEELVNRAMGPVWEANHIWLIILIVILFNGFPSVYTKCSVYFHIPLTLMLVGIVFRGCAFTFRHYDAVKDDAHRYYTFAFSLSSILTPVMFGMILGGMFFGVDVHATGYYQQYVASWFNFPSFAVGLFTLSLFSYLAAAYLIGEAEDKITRQYYTRAAQKTSVLMLIAGALVFILSQFSPHPLFNAFFANPISIVSFILATLLTVIFWRRVAHGRLTEWEIRLIAGSQAALVLCGWLALSFPSVLFFKGGGSLTLFDAAAPMVTINILGWSLILGSLLFLPILFYLIRVFKLNE